MKKQEFILELRVLLRILEQIILWRTDLDVPKDRRIRKDKDDKGIVQLLRYWLTSYYNGKKLRYGWKIKIIKVDCQLCEDYGITWPYKKGGCYGCDENYSNYKRRGGP